MEAEIQFNPTQSKGILFAVITCLNAAQSRLTARIVSLFVHKCVPVGVCGWLCSTEVSVFISVALFL